MNQHGGHVADIISDDASKHSTISALETALEKLSCHECVCQWTPDKSLLKLIYVFCLPELQELLETIKVLSSRTKDLEKLCFLCYEKGEIAKLGALLLFALDSSMDPPAGELFRRSLVEERKSTRFLKSDSEDIDSLIIKRRNLIRADDLFRIMVVARDYIDTYRRHMLEAEHDPVCYVPYEVGYGLLHRFCEVSTYVNHVITLTSKDVESDDMPCFLPKLEGDNMDALNKALETHISLASDDMPVFVCKKREYADCDEEDVPDGHEYECALETAIEFERKDDFVKLINSAKCQEDIPIFTDTMLFYDSVNCFAAVLDGETGDLVTLRNMTRWAEGFGHNLLHAASNYRSIRILAKFLEKGYGHYANVRADTSFWFPQLPLNLALENFRTLCLEEWTGTSPVELVIRLCDYELRASLEVVRLLARHTRNIPVEFVKYVREGKMVEVGALLLVARKQLCSSFALGNLGQRTVTQPQSEEGLPLVLLDIFGKVGDKLEAYVQLKRDFKLTGQQLALEVAAILQGAGFTVRHKELYVTLDERCTFSEEFEKRLRRKSYGKLEYQKVEESWKNYVAGAGLALLDGGDNQLRHSTFLNDRLLQTDRHKLNTSNLVKLRRIPKPMFNVPPFSLPSHTVVMRSNSYGRLAVQRLYSAVRHLVTRAR